MGKLLRMNLLLIVLVLVNAKMCFPEETAPGRLSPVEGAFKKSAGAGWMLPAEGDLDGGFVFGLGMKYARESDVFFLDWMYSATDVEFDLFNLDSNVKHNIFQGGYMMNFGVLNRCRAGAGVQLHQMNFSNLGRRSGTTVTGLFEHDLTKRLTLRLQTALPVESETIDMGAGLAVTIWSEF